MSMTTFVNISHPSDVLDPSVRRTVRRHVMKDIGRGRRKRPRPTIVQLQVRMPPSGQAEVDSKATIFNVESENRPDLTLRDGFHHQIQVPRPPHASGIFGLDLGESELEIVHFMRAESDYKYRPFHVIWIRIGLSDPTAFYLSLASTVLFRDHMHGEMNMRYSDNPKSAKYYNKALGQLATRLQDAQECKSAGVVATILGCLCHDTGSGNWDRWAVHIEGLDRISKLRGGFDELEGEIPLMAFWLDLVGGTVMDLPPRFPILYGLDTNIRQTSPWMLDFLNLLTLTHPELSWISPLFQQLRAITEEVNNNADSNYFWQQEVKAIRMLGPITHQLLSLERWPSMDNQGNAALATGELARLAFLMLLSGLKKRFCLNYSDMPHLQARFTNVLAQMPDHLNEPVAQLKLWALITSATLQESSMDMGLVLHICQLLPTQGYSDSNAAIAFAKDIIWINGLQGHGGKQLAMKIDEYNAGLYALSAVAWHEPAPPPADYPNTT